MSKKLLVTDSFFISESHVKRLEEAGYEVSCLEKAAATEEELIEALHEVSVYIIGGIEQVTEAVIASTDRLEAIIFCGVDYDKFIPAAESATQKGIKLLNAPGANALAVAEFAVGVAIAMQRDLFRISRTGDTKFETTKSIQNATIGLIGAGNIAQTILKQVQAFKPAEIVYYSRSPKDISARPVSLEELVAVSDIIFLTLPMKAGTVLNHDIISQVKMGCLIVSISPMNLIDFEALLPRLQTGELRCAIDFPAPSPEFEALPLDVWFHTNSHSAYNTQEAIRAVSDAVTEVVIGLI